MKLYKVYKHASGTYEVVKQGWSWPGFLFIFIWAFVKKMWVIGVIAFFCYWILGTLINMFKGETDAFVLHVISITANCIFGMFGNGWRETNLASRGFMLTNTVTADSPEEAITSVMKSDVQATANRNAIHLTRQNEITGTSKEKKAETSVSTSISNSENANKIMQSHTLPQANPLDEGAIYQSIANELESGKADKGLWTRLFAEFDGDETRIKVAYIKKRAEHLISIERARLEQEEREHDAFVQKRRHYEAALQIEAKRIKEDYARYKKVISLAKEHSATPRKPIDEKIALLKYAGGDFEWTKGYERYGFCSATFGGETKQFKSGAEFSTWFNSEVVPYLLTL